MFTVALDNIFPGLSSPQSAAWKPVTLFCIAPRSLQLATTGHFSFLGHETSTCVCYIWQRQKSNQETKRQLEGGKSNLVIFRDNEHLGAWARMEGKGGCTVVKEPHCTLPPKAGEKEQQCAF